MKLNNDIVKQRLKEVFGNEYDLSLVNYINKNENITLVCRKHGEFSARLSSFTKRHQRCQDCKKDEQLESYLKFLNDNCEYISFVPNQVYRNSKQKYKFNCKIHGGFNQTWNSITRGTNCPKCGDKRLKQFSKNRTTPISDILKQVNEVSKGRIKILNPNDYENSHSRLTFECYKGHTWSVKLYNVLQGKGCAKCAGLRITTEEFAAKVKEIHSDKIVLLSGQKYRGRTKKLLFKCHVDVHPIFSAAPNNIIFQKSGCPECKKDTLRDAFSFNTEEVYEKINNKFKGRIYALPNQTYVNQHSKWWFSCLEESHPEWESPIGSVLNSEYKYGCRYCYGEQPTTTVRDIKKRLKEVFDTRIQLVSVNDKKITSAVNITVKCFKHQKLHSEKFANIIKSYGCPDCSEENRRENSRTDKETLINQIKEVHREFVTLINPEDYINTDTQLKFKCYKKKHGVFNSTPHRILRGVGCPVCKTSKGERAILFWLRDNNIEHIWQHRVIKHIGEGHFIYDFYLPQHDCLIEYDGRQHFIEIEAWGGAKSLKNIQRIDKLKDEYAELNDLKMLRIQYTDLKKIDTILHSNFSPNK
jgi:very-short-patch-repair endonuclease